MSEEFSFHHPAYYFVHAWYLREWEDRAMHGDLWKFVAALHAELETESVKDLGNFYPAVSVEPWEEAKQWIKTGKRPRTRRPNPRRNEDRGKWVRRLRERKRPPTWPACLDLLRRHVARGGKAKDWQIPSTWQALEAADRRFLVAQRKQEHNNVE